MKAFPLNEATMLMTTDNYTANPSGVIHHNCQTFNRCLVMVYILNRNFQNWLFITQLTSTAQKSKCILLKFSKIIWSLSAKHLDENAFRKQKAAFHGGTNKAFLIY
jgi:hypothetical protein